MHLILKPIKIVEHKSNQKGDYSKMKWQDIYDIVEKLEDKYPQENILQIRYTDLHKMIIELDGFNDDATKSNEKILEAIQMLWLQERD